MVESIKSAIKNDQIAEVNIIFYKIWKGKPLFLLMKRHSKRGGFWQSLTGGVKINQTLKEAALAEAEEETSLKININKLLPTYYSYNFMGEGYELNEYVFIYKLGSQDIIKIDPKEHTDYKFVTLREALNLLKYQSNKIALKTAYELLTNKEKIAA